MHLQVSTKLIRKKTTSFNYLCNTNYSVPIENYIVYY